MLNMRNLKQGLMDHTELTKRGRRLLRSGSFFYFILLCLMCFLPQQPEPGMETPGIQHFGRIVVLLVLQLLWLWPWLRSCKRVLCFGFAMSLWIECSQVLLDLLFDANRVFELDDLWTNTLGAYLAYIGFQYFRARLLAKNGKM